MYNLINLILLISVSLICIKGWGKTFIKTLLPTLCSFFLTSFLIKKEPSIYLDLIYKIVALIFIVFFIYRSLKNSGSLYVIKSPRLFISIIYSILLTVICCIIYKDENNTLYHIPLFLVIFPLFFSLLFYEILWKVLPLKKSDSVLILPYVVILIYTFLLSFLHQEAFHISFIYSFVFFVILSFIKKRWSDSRYLFIESMLFSSFYFVCYIIQK